MRDARSGAAVAGALLSLGDRQALASTDGSVRFLGLATGRLQLRVEAFGYRPLERNVTVSVGMAPIELRLEPDPIQLRELTVTGNARASLGGVVLNARSGEVIPFADLTLTSGGTRQVGRLEVSDDRGSFTIANIASGEYLLRVDRLGFVSQYMTVSHAVPPLPLEVRLAPDSAVMRGLSVMNGELDLRREASAYIARAFSEGDLRRSRAAGMRQFVEAYTPLTLVECGDPPKKNCVLIRGAAARPRLFIDEILTFDVPPPPALPGRNPNLPPPVPPPPPIAMDVLEGYDPRDFHSVDYFECNGIEIHVYTYQYMERMARRPRVPLGVCSP